MKVKTIAKLLTCVAMLTGFAGSLSAENRWEMEGGINALDSSRYDHGETTSTTLSVDLLIWKAHQANLDYAISATTDSGSIFDGTVHYVDHEYDVGFRIPFSFNTCYDGWNINFDFTYFEDTESSRATRPNDGRLLATWISPETLDDGNFEDIDSISARNKIRYNTYDLYLSRPTFLTCHVDMTPFFGVRVLYLDQSQSATLELDGYEYDEYINYYDDGEVIAGGLYGGLRNSFHLCGGLSLATKLGVSLVAGEIENTTYEMLSEEQESGSKNLYVVDERNVILPGLELAAGLNYESCMCGGYVNLRVGYEFVQWWNTPNNRRYFDDNTRERGLSHGSHDGQLGFHGVYIGGDYTF